MKQFACIDKIHLLESQGISEVQSHNVIESDIDPFETIYGKMDEDSFHQMMEGNDEICAPLFSDKVFLNEDWHKQQELQKRIEAKVKQEKGKKGKAKKKIKPETSETGDTDLQITTVTPIEVRDIQPDYSTSTSNHA